MIWDEDKRLANIAKHGFDFVDACEVLDSRYRLDIPVVRNREHRTESFSYALGFLAVLTVVHTERDGATRVISFRRASEKEWAKRNGRDTMPGSKTNSMTLEEVRAAVRAIPSEQHFVWDGIDEDERPATVEEMNAGIEPARRGRGRPAGSGNKEQVAIRFDNDVLAAFRSAGPGWQTRMNAALRDWLKTHSPA
ncbi:MAG: BrnA antitoxin family protein [Sulfuricellaceae bacterium]